ncbi:MAG TPA: M48 family metallopeptidase, partial [Flavobacteriaceae bacterium]|nr:M48 family metallopeptidase [Flavobacteriaceae bacterium]
MTANFIFGVLIFILIADYIFNSILDYLNAKKFDDELPKKLKDVYAPDEYLRSQQYKKERSRFSTIQTGFSLVLILVFLFLDGFAFINDIALSISENEILTGLIFFGIILLASAIINIPFSYYSTFVIEEKYGFNKMSRKTFFLDLIKGAVMTSIIGGGILALVIWIYQLTGSSFWLYAWGFITAFSLFMNMFYSRLIVPIFNKQSPLEEGSLRTKIETYANKVGFALDNIFVIDGSKRSTKANAYFSGFGREKRITLYDTLIDDLEEEEI